MSTISRERLFSFLLAVVLVVGLYFSSLYNYLLFHSLAELFSIVIAFAIFAITWNSRKYIENFYLLLIGIAYLFIGGIDLLHTLSYKGMQIFKDYDYYANQLWIGARYMESLTFLLASLFFYTRKRVKEKWIISTYTLISIVLLLSVFYWKIFPICFVEGKGLTPFKKISEYIISLILVADMIFLIKNKAKFAKAVFDSLVVSLIFTILSELAFTIYVDNYGVSNLVGHYFKIFSFFYLYKAIIEIGLKMPYEIIFRELTIKDQTLQQWAVRDDLTGTYNRRTAFEFLEEQVTLATLLDRPLSICFIDIDHLKDINDQFGHHEGDILITSVSNLVLDAIRDRDRLCRIGGDEFLLVLPDCSFAQASVILARIKGKLETLSRNNPNSYVMDFSYGLVEFNLLDHQAIDNFVEEADNRMYQDKYAKKAREAACAGTQ
ncbi:MAG: sensor domain-containing diguanylate cyclase [Desulfitobacteriaceae bacterium]